MTTPSESLRFRSFTWLLLQAIATVASILLAFGIDAWWDQRKETVKKDAMLQSVRKEMLSILESSDHECVFRRSSLENVKLLLKATAAGVYSDKERSLDRRLADLIWFSPFDLPTGAVGSLLASGGLSDINDIKLREELAAYPRVAGEYASYRSRDQRVLLEVVAPFLSRKANLLHLSNESFRLGRPGDGYGQDLAGIIPLSNVEDYGQLLTDREFSGVLIQKLWIDVELQSHLCSDVKDYVNEIVRSIDRELAATG